MHTRINLFTKSLIIALLAICLTASTSSAAPLYTDIPKNHEAADAVSFLAERQLMDGFSDGTFRPDATMTRGDAYKLMVDVSKHLELKYPKGRTGKDRTLKIRDRKTGKTRTLSIAEAFPNHLIIQGRPVKNVFPKRPVTNAQYARMISDTLQLPKASSVNLMYTDLPKRNRYWYKEVVQNNVAAGILPNTKTRFNSHRSMTRGEIAQQLTAAIRYHLNIEPDFDTPIDDSLETETPAS